MSPIRRRSRLPVAPMAMKPAARMIGGSGKSGAAWLGTDPERGREAQRHQRAGQDPQDDPCPAERASASAHGAHRRRPIAPSVSRSASPVSATMAGGQDRGREQRRPDLHGLAVIGAGQQPRAQAGLGAGRQLGDDGADEADRDRDLEAGEQERHRGRPAQLPEGLPAAGMVGAHQIELHRLRRGQALHHADRHREEAQIGRDQRLRHEALEADRAQHDDDDGGDGQDRNRLRGDDPGQQTLLQRPHVHDQHREHDADHSCQWRSPAASRPASPRRGRRGCAWNLAAWPARYGRARPRPDAAPATAAAPGSLSPRASRPCPVLAGSVAIWRANGAFIQTAATYQQRPSRTRGPVAAIGPACCGGPASIVIGMPGPQPLAHPLRHGQELGRLAEVERPVRAADRRRSRR